MSNKLAFFILIAACGCKPDGEYKSYYKEGQLKIVKHFLDGQLDGVHVTYFKNGQKETEVNYLKGKMQGNWISYYENGDTSMIMPIKSDVKNGVIKEFYLGNRLKRTGAWVDNYEDGPEELFNENGSLQMKGYYRLGVKDSIWQYFDEKGQLLKSELWKMGKQIE